MAKEKVNDQEVYDLYQLCCETVRPLSAVLRDQGPSGVLCGLWSELRQIHELAAPPAVERKAGEDGSGGTAQGSQGADNRQAQQQSYREDGSETAGR